MNGLVGAAHTKPGNNMGNAAAASDDDGNYGGGGCGGDSGSGSVFQILVAVKAEPLGQKQ